MDKNNPINLTETDSVTSYWNQRYSNEQTGWDRGESNSALSRWIERGLLNPCTIFIPCCGRGHEVVQLAQQGFEVTAVDLADEPLQFLNQNLLTTNTSANVVRANVFEFAPVQQFDAVYDQTCLCAISPDLRVDYEKKLFNWLRVGGKLFILFVQTENANGEPPYHCSLEDMRLLFNDRRWDWSSEELERYDHPSGRIFELATTLTKKGEPNAG